MIRTFALAATPLPPADPRAKLPVGPTDRRDPAGPCFRRRLARAFSCAYRFAA